MKYTEYCTESEKNNGCTGCLPCDYVAEWDLWLTAAA